MSQISTKIDLRIERENDQSGQRKAYSCNVAAALVGGFFYVSVRATWEQDRRGDLSDILLHLSLFLFLEGCHCLVLTANDRKLADFR